MLVQQREQQKQLWQLDGEEEGRGEMLYWVVVQRTSWTGGSKSLAGVFEVLHVLLKQKAQKKQLLSLEGGGGAGSETVVVMFWAVQSFGLVRLWRGNWQVQGWWARW